VSPALVAELREVLARPKFRRSVSFELATEFVDGLEEAAMMIDDPPVGTRISSDPDDDYLIRSGARG
jgi:predicted nucleic acid-binding protein